MKHVLLIWVILTFSQSSAGQTVERTRLVSIPEENFVIAIVNQPQCPLKILEARLFTKEDGHYPIVRYVFQNTGTKKIRYFSIRFMEKFSIKSWHRFGSSYEDGTGSEDGKGPDLLRKGQIYSNWPEKEFEIVPITENVTKLFESKADEPRLKFIGLGMVTKVVFSDGSTFDATTQSSEIYDLFMSESVDYTIQINRQD